MKGDGSLPAAGPARGLRWLSSLGRRTDHLVHRGGVFGVVFGHGGGIGILFWQVILSIVRLRVSLRSILNQLYAMGVESIPIVIVTGALAGIVTSQQGGYQMLGAIPLYYLGSLVTTTVVIEMGPVLTAIVLVGRVGARVTAELGTMKVSEQMDAFHSLGRDPIPILASPRIIAGVIVLPLLVGIANMVGLLAGMVAARWNSGLGYESFLYGAKLTWHSWDVFYSFVKAAVFGLAIPLISVHMGFRTRGGAEGVGRQTTDAVMFMTLTVLILDAMFPPLMLD